MAVTYHIYEKIKRKLQWGECFLPFSSEHLIFPPHILYKNLHIEAGLFKTIMLPVSNLVEQAKWFENRVLSTMFEPNEKEVGENFVKGNFIVRRDRRMAKSDN